MYQESLKRTVRGGKWISILLILPFMLMGPAGVQAQEEEKQEEQKCSTVTICPDQVGEEDQECRTVKVCGTDEAVDPERLAELVERIRSLAERRRDVDEDRIRHLAEEVSARAEHMHQMEAGQAQEIAERYADVAARYRDAGREYQERLGQVYWMRSGARIGISLDGTQDPDLDLQGAEITSVVEDSPADEAGLQEGDIVTHIDGHSLLEPIPDEDEDREDWGDSSLPVTRLISLARGLEPGDVVEVRYLRDGDSHSVSVEAAEVDSPQFYVGRWPRGERGFFRWDPEEGEAWNYRFDPDAFENLNFHFESDSFPNYFFRRESPIWVTPQMEGRLEGLLEGELAGGLHLAFESCGEGVFFGNCVAGLELRELNEGLGGYFGTTEGVLVLSVGEEPELAIEPGDVILAVGGRDVGDPSGVRRSLGSYDED